MKSDGPVGRRKYRCEGALLLLAGLLIAPLPASASPEGERVVAPSITVAAPGSAREQGAPVWQPPTAPQAAFPSPIDEAQAQELAERWGVKLLSLSLSAAGYMMDFRFRVLDTEKALALFDHRSKPYVVVERSQAKLPVPISTKVGAFRPTNRGRNIKADKNYYMMFANPDRHVKAGERVTVVIGDFTARNLTVN